MATKTTVKGKSSGPKARIAELERRIAAANAMNTKRRKRIAELKKQ